MTTLRGTLRSTETKTTEASGASIGEARSAVLAALDLDAYELQRATVQASKATGESVIQAVARSRATKVLEVTGPTYEVAMQTFRSSIENGWQALNVRAID